MALVMDGMVGRPEMWNVSICEEYCVKKIGSDLVGIVARIESVVLRSGTTFCLWLGSRMGPDNEEDELQDLSLTTVSTARQI